MVSISFSVSIRPYPGRQGQGSEISAAIPDAKDLASASHKSRILQEEFQGQGTGEGNTEDLIIRTCIYIFHTWTA